MRYYQVTEETFDPVKPKPEWIEQLLDEGRIGLNPPNWFLDHTTECRCMGAYIIDKNSDWNFVTSNDPPAAKPDSDPDLSAPILAKEMTLLDHFAGQALMGWLATYEEPHPAWSGDRQEEATEKCARVADLSYTLAQAMMEERKKRLP